jgi:uncharacterized SAM-binding protein YcdF (DUF218 family)
MRPANSMLFILGIALALYFINISIYWGRFYIFNFLMIIAGAVVTVTSFTIDKIREVIHTLPKLIYNIGKTGCILFALSFAVAEGFIIGNMRGTAVAGADYMIVLGCQVDGAVPSIPLMRRVAVAVKYLNENPDTNAVITGGQGPGEHISEAEAMKRLLKYHGINEDRIFEEHNATSTLENLQFADTLYNLTDKRVVLVSSDYHLFRALSMAKKLSYTHITGLPAKSQLAALPAYLLREYVAVMYYITLRRI